MEIGIKQGMEKGKVEGILSPIRSLLLSIGRTAEQVMEALQTSETDRSHYVALLKNAQRFKRKSSRFWEWNDALSITITVPCSRKGRSWLENQNSKSLLTLQHILIFPIQICIHTAFIHIGDLFQRISLIAS